MLRMGISHLSLPIWFLSNWGEKDHKYEITKLPLRGGPVAPTCNFPLTMGVNLGSYMQLFSYNGGSCYGETHFHLRWMLACN